MTLVGGEVDASYLALSAYITGGSSSASPPQQFQLIPSQDSYVFVRVPRSEGRDKLEGLKNAMSYPMVSWRDSPMNKVLAYMWPKLGSISSNT